MTSFTIIIIIISNVIIILNITEEKYKQKYVFLVSSASTCLSVTDELKLTERVCV